MEALLPFLGFDLSTPATLVVLATGPGRIFSRRKTGGNRAEGLFPALEEVLAEAGLAMREIRCLGVGRGPGAFTGIRNAVMAAKTLAWANGVPLYAPDSLEILARGAPEGDAVVPLIDARRGEVYADVFLRDAEGLRATGAPVVLPPGELPGLIAARCPRPGVEPVLTGTGATAYRETLETLGRIADDPFPRPEALLDACRAAHLAGLAEDPLSLEPLYVREPDAVARNRQGRG